jgi:hypothetical protein
VFGLDEIAERHRQQRHDHHQRPQHGRMNPCDRQHRDQRRQAAPQQDVALEPAIREQRRTDIRLARQAGLPLVSPPRDEA